MAKGTFASKTFGSRTFGSVTLAGPQTVVSPLTLVWASRVHQYSTTTGTGNLTVSSGPNATRTFLDVMNAGDVCEAFIVNQSANEWESTQLTMNADGTLTRGVYSFDSQGNPTNTGLARNGSNGTTLVTFSAGTKDVYIDVPAELVVNVISVPNFAGIVR